MQWAKQLPGDPSTSEELAPVYSEASFFGSNRKGHVLRKSDIGLRACQRQPDVGLNECQAGRFWRCSRTSNGTPGSSFAPRITNEVFTLATLGVVSNSDVRKV